MSFLLPCPNCGARRMDEFAFGGEFRARPASATAPPAWGHYLYSRLNVAGWQTEWWFHRLGCGLWFLAERHTVTNEVRRTFWRSAVGAVEAVQGMKELVEQAEP